MAWSEDGKSHFADCKVIFWIIIVLAIISLAASIVLLILRKKGRFEFRTFQGHSLGFYLGIAVFVILTVVLVWGLIDFQSLFKTFHSVFFPGKDNWVFDMDADQIILILPEQFFINCAIFIGGVFLLFCAGCIVEDTVRRHRQCSDKIQ